MLRFVSGHFHSAFGSYGKFNNLPILLPSIVILVIVHRRWTSSSSRCLAYYIIYLVSSLLPPRPTSTLATAGSPGVATNNDSWTSNFDGHTNASIHKPRSTSFERDDIRSLGKTLCNRRRFCGDTIQREGKEGVQRRSNFCTALDHPETTLQHVFQVARIDRVQAKWQ